MDKQAIQRMTLKSQKGMMSTNKVVRQKEMLFSGV